MATPVAQPSGSTVLIQPGQATGQFAPLPTQGAPIRATGGIPINNEADVESEASRQDSSDVWVQVFNAAFAQLRPVMGDQNGRQAAYRAANRAQEKYAADLKAGVAPGVARTNAIAVGQADADATARANGAPVSSAADPTGNASGSQVGSADLKLAIDQYREGVASGKDVYSGIVNDPTNDPNARDTFQRVQGQQTSTMFVAAPRENRATVVNAPDKPITVTASGQGAIKTTDAVAAGAIPVQQMTPAERLAAALQAKTTVGATGLDVTQSDESRQVVNTNLQDLQATAKGEGAGQIAAAARTKLALAKVAAAASAGRSARGSERRGALLAGQSAATEAGAQAIAQNEITSAQERQQAQTAVGQQALATRGQDVDVAAKKAQLDQERAKLQASLDQAKSANDQAAINSINLKLTELDQQAKALNAEATNTANEQAAGRSTTVSLANAQSKNTAQEQGADRQADLSKTNAGFINTAGESDAARRLAAATTSAGIKTTVDQNNVTNRTTVALANQAADQSTQQFNSGQAVQVGSLNNQQGLAANVAGSQQDVDQAKLRIQAQEALEKSAQGLLDEAGRQAALKMAQEQMALAQSRFANELDQQKKEEARKDRDYWTGLVTSLAAKVITGGVKPAAHGGIVDKPTHLLVGEAGPEIIIPVNGVSERLARALSVDAKPFDRETAPTMAELASALRAARPQEDERKERDFGALAALFAAGNMRARKANY